jgi:ABC-type transporter Mla subunit MlaD
MVKKIAVLLFISIMLLACEAKNLTLSVRFDHIDGLKANDSVIYGIRHIGKVDDVTYTKNGDYLVNLTIPKANAKDVTEHVRFYIDSDSQNNGRSVVEMIKIYKGGKPLPNNTVLEGSSKPSAIVEGFGKNLEHSVDIIKKEFNEFAEELKKIPDNEAYKKVENQLSDIYEKMKQSGKEVREMIQKEILPRIEQELKNLKKRLQEKGREDELKPLEIKMKEIKKI